MSRVLNLFTAMARGRSLDSLAAFTLKNMTQGVVPVGRLQGVSAWSAPTAAQGKIACQGPLAAQPTRVCRRSA